MFKLIFTIKPLSPYFNDLQIPGLNYTRLWALFGSSGVKNNADLTGIKGKKQSNVQCPTSNVKFRFNLQRSTFNG